MLQSPAWGEAWVDPGPGPLAIEARRWVRGGRTVGAHGRRAEACHGPFYVFGALHTHTKNLNPKKKISTFAAHAAFQTSPIRLHFRASHPPPWAFIGRPRVKVSTRALDHPGNAERGRSRPLPAARPQSPAAAVTNDRPLGGSFLRVLEAGSLQCGAALPAGWGWGSGLCLSQRRR